MKRIADFAPEGVESGVGLVIQDDDGRYLFFLAGTRHRCPPGELFYAGIGGHREPGEDWLECARREAMEEVGSNIDVLPSPVTWYLPQEGAARQVELADRPRPYALYEMIHPPGTPRAGGLYRIVIYNARLHKKPHNFPPDEVRGVIGLTKEQVMQSLGRKPQLAELLQEGALLVDGQKQVDHHIRLFPLGTARAVAHVINQTETYGLD